jgi:hypothetical protein
VVTAVGAVHTLIHEMIHAKDHYLEKKSQSNSPLWENPTNEIFIMEALTESKARLLAAELITNKPSFEPYATELIGAYKWEVGALKFLEKIRPGVSNALWESATYGEKEKIITTSIRNWIFDQMEIILKNNNDPQNRVSIKKYFKRILSNVSDNSNCMKIWRHGELEYLSNLLDEGVYSWWKLYDVVKNISKYTQIDAF